MGFILGGNTRDVLWRGVLVGSARCWDDDDERDFMDKEKGPGGEEGGGGSCYCGVAGL